MSSQLLDSLLLTRVPVERTTEHNRNTLPKQQLYALGAKPQFQYTQRRRATAETGTSRNEKSSKNHEIDADTPGTDQATCLKCAVPNGGVFRSRETSASVLQNVVRTKRTNSHTLVSDGSVGVGRGGRFGGVPRTRGSVRGGVWVFVRGFAQLLQRARTRLGPSRASINHLRNRTAACKRHARGCLCVIALTEPISTTPGNAPASPRQPTPTSN
jgi:hypothetical protein